MESKLDDGFEQLSPGSLSKGHWYLGVFLGFTTSTASSTDRKAFIVLVTAEGA